MCLYFFIPQHGQECGPFAGPFATIECLNPGPGHRLISSSLADSESRMHESRHPFFHQVCEGWRLGTVSAWLY